MAVKELSPAKKRELVEKAERIAERIMGGKDPRGQATQLRNMVVMAGKESEIPVLCNFIEYQAGRRSTRDLWSKIHKDVTDVLRNLDKEPDLRADADLRKTAVVSFFGYLVRKYVYLAETSKAQVRSEREEE